MHGVEELSMTGVRGTSQVVNGSSTPGVTAAPPSAAATQVIPTSVLTKTVSKVGGTTPILAGATTGTAINVCQGTTIMPRPAVVTSATPNGAPVSVPLQPGMQIFNIRTNQGVQMAGTRNLPPRMILNHLTGVRPGQPGLTLQNLTPGGQGQYVIKGDGIQLQLVRFNAAPGTAGQIPSIAAQNTAPAMMVQTTNNALRYQQPQVSGTMSLSNNTSVVSQPVAAGGQAIVVPASVVTTAAVVSTTSVAVPVTATATTSSPAAQQTPNTPAVGTQTISADSAKTKCKNFLATLLRLAGEQRAKVAQNVRNLIQGLIDGKVEPESFTEELQKDLNSAPQPCLVPFLKKTLPYLRASLAKGELTIEGVRPPPLSSVQPVTGMTTVIPSMVRQSSLGSGPVRLVTPGSTGSGAALVQRVGHNAQTVISNSPRVVTPMQQVRFGKVVTAVKTSTAATALANSSSNSPASSLASGGSFISSSAKSSKASASKEDKKKDKTVSYNSFSSSGVADDDINDVAAMGGVNLGEESQRILDSTGFVGTHIRSCKDETFLLSQPLTQRVRQICSEYGLDEPSKDVVSLVSHATQERLKTLVQKLAVIAEHRLDIIKMDSRYDVVQDVKGQLKFLEELDKLEKKRKDEQEREMLLRAAKSRSKSEDPEQAKLKAKAKEMQRVEMEEMRQRDANLTAMKALQTKKKPRLDPEVEENGIFGGNVAQKQMPLRPRIKRVNMRDAIFLMEQEKDLNKSALLYRTHLK